MYHKRVCPTLLISDSGLVKTKKFRQPSYVGDPINTIRIFNEKQVDEIIILDIDAWVRNEVKFDLLKEVASEAFVPLSYGGGLKSLGDLEYIFKIGFEKVIINKAADYSEEFIVSAVQKFGSSSIVGCVDVARSFLKKNYRLRRNKTVTISEKMKRLQDAGVGEIMVVDSDRDGTYAGLDLDLAEKVTKHCIVPVIMVGGTSNYNDAIHLLNDTEVQAVGVGSAFIYRSQGQGVLINYPDRSYLRTKIREYI